MENTEQVYTHEEYRASACIYTEQVHMVEMKFGSFCITVSLTGHSPQSPAHPLHYSVTDRSLPSIPCPPFILQCPQSPAHPLYYSVTDRSLPSIPCPPFILQCH